MTNEGDRALTRGVIERRLAWERAAFLGLLAAFLVLLFLDPTPPPEGVAGLLGLAAVVALVGAGFDGAREAVHDLDLLAGLLERAGPGARVERMPFWMRGHYEIWFDAPSAAGPNAFGVSFANSLFFGAKRSVYLLMVPVAGAGQDRWAEPRLPLKEALVSGEGRDKALEYFLRRGRGKAGGWQVRLFVRPGRPMTAGNLWDLKQRAVSVAEAVAREGPSAVAWGRTERFRPPDPVEAGSGGSVALREP